MAALTEDQIDRLIDAGGRRWTKAGYDRIYINWNVIGLELDFYKSGNVSWAAWQGDRISHTDGWRIQAGKAFVDIATSEIVAKCSFRPGYQVMSYEEAIKRFVSDALADKTDESAGATEDPAEK